jgi:hypothetical protein
MPQKPKPEDFTDTPPPDVPEGYTAIDVTALGDPERKWFVGVDPGQLKVIPATTPAPTIPKDTGIDPHGNIQDPIKLQNYIQSVHNAVIGAAPWGPNRPAPKAVTQFLQDTEGMDHKNWKEQYLGQWEHSISVGVLSDTNRSAKEYIRNKFQSHPDFARMNFHIVTEMDHLRGRPLQHYTWAIDPAAYRNPRIRELLSQIENRSGGQRVDLSAKGVTIVTISNKDLGVSAIPFNDVIMVRNLIFLRPKINLPPNFHDRNIRIDTSFDNILETRWCAPRWEEDKWRKEGQMAVIEVLATERAPRHLVPARRKIVDPLMPKGEDPDEIDLDTEFTQS